MGWKQIMSNVVQVFQGVDIAHPYHTFLRDHTCNADRVC